MPAVVDPVSGLEYYELSHRWGMYTPIFPGYEEIKLERITHHAKQGVMTHKITTIFHTSTHVNAPMHLIPGAAGVGELALDRFFGTGVVVSIPKRKWGLIEPSDLERAKPQIKAGDIVLIDTGWHRKYSDSKEYFGYAPGLSKAAAAWLVKKRVKLVGIDTATRRSSAGDVARPAPQRPADQISAPGIQGGDRPRGDQGFPRMESGAPRIARRRHSDHRECRRRSR